MDSVALIQRLLNEVAEHLHSNSKPGRRAAAIKLERITVVASTLALTIRTAG